MAQYIADARRERRYHHGDLRGELLRVARHEIARHGVQAVSLSSLARLAGVTQPAPYRHFPDRDALLEAVAVEAFADFTRTLTAAIEGRGPAEALNALALAYFEFGEANIELYRLMFASRLTPKAEGGSELDKASGRAFGLLCTAVLSISVTSLALAEERTYLAWAQLHGLMMLKADGFIRSPLRKFAQKWAAATLNQHASE